MKYEIGKEYKWKDFIYHESQVDDTRNIVFIFKDEVILTTILNPFTKDKKEQENPKLRIKEIWKR